MHLKASKGIPGSDLSVFRQFLSVTERLVDQVEEGSFHSLYTVIPLVTQLLGLENPLFGSGKSPYSIISLLPRMKDRKSIQWPFELSIEDRRVLIDELYEMIAPVLLGEEEAYTELLMETVYSDVFHGKQELQLEFRKVQKEKFEVLAPLVHRLKKEEPRNFAHIAHYGYTSDLEREHGFLRTLSPELFDQWCQRSFPTVFELNFRDLGAGGKDVRGWVIVINNSTEQLLNSHKLRKAKILQCAALADRLGARIVGMAGLIAFFGKGGYFLSERYPHLSFTTGHAFTIANIREIAKAAIQRTGKKFSELTVAVIGAAGSIGSGCAKLFAEMGVPRMVLVDILWQDSLPDLVGVLRQIHPSMEVHCSNRLQDMRSADLSIIATNSPRTIIESEMLKPGSIIIDDAFPKNVPESIIQDRDDVIALEGGIVRLPSRVEIDRGRNVPNVMDVPLTRMISCQEIYGCFAETLTLAAVEHTGNFGLGPSDPSLAKDIFIKARDVGFALAPLQFFGQAVNEKRFGRLQGVVDTD